MLPTSPGAARIRLSIALAVVLAIGGALYAFGVFSGGGGPMSAQERALIEAFEKKTGLGLSISKAELDASAGTWRGLGVELRARGVEGPLGRPLLSASMVELKLDTSGLVRGELRIEHASLHDAVLNVDRRSGAQADVDASALLDALPASIEAKGAKLVVYSDAGYATLAGLSATLVRGGDALRGQLAGPGATLLLQPLKEDVRIEPVALALAADVVWQPSGLALSALQVTRAQSTFKGDAQLGAASEVLRLRSDSASLSDLAALLEPALAGIEGKGAIELELSPSALKGRLDLRDVRAHGAAFDRVQANLERKGTAFVLSALTAERGEARVRADELSLDAEGVRSGSVQLERVPLRPVLGALFGAVPADGVARGALRIARSEAGAASVRAELTLEAPAISGYRFDKGELRAQLAFEGGRAHEVAIEALELSGKSAQLRASGTASPSGQIALDASGRLTLGAHQLEGQGKVTGPWARPETSATLGSAGSGPLALSVRLSGKDIREGMLELRAADFASRMPALENAGAAHGVASARIALRGGRIDDVRSFAGEGELTQIELGYGERRLKSAAAVPLALSRGRVELRGLTLTDQTARDVRFDVSGAIDLDRGLDLSARAQLPLAELLATTPFIGAVEGRVDAKLTLDGPLDDPRMRGEAETQGAQLEIGPAKLPWREVHAIVVLDREGLSLRRGTGKLGTGTLSVDGSIGLSGVKARELALALTLKSFEVEPEPRFEVVLAADSTLKWKAGDALPVLGGVVSLSRLHYGRHVQLPEAVIAIGRGKKVTRAPTLALDLHVVSAAPITIRNDFLDAELEISSKLGPGKAIHVVGTDTQIGALGELTVTRGRALFRGATLTIRHGVIKLVSDDRVVPALDLAADAPAKRRPGGLIAFRAKGDPRKFDLSLHCETKDGGSVPPPFECDYAGDAMRCGAFEELTALWACQPPL